MRYVKIIFLVLFAGVVIAFLDYTLPSRDIVRVVGTEVVRMDVGERALFWASSDTQSGQPGTRDVRFINTVFPDGGTRVYRNEDTGFGWPPYFKFDSGNLQAEAQEIQSIEENWVLVSHYGWRSTLASIFPNAVSMKRVIGPDAAGINWVRIIGFMLSAFMLLVIWRLWSHFRNWLIDRFEWLRFRKK